MRKNFKTLAGMAVCILGALAASSCSKDEFFGLEDSEVLDYSAKYEIATSQAYADYAIACFEMAETMNQPVDTTEMKVCGEINGKPVYAKVGSCTSALGLLAQLKKIYPELEKADVVDMKEIQSIALSNNAALKDYASYNVSETKTWFNGSNWDAGRWAQSNGKLGASFGDDGWWFSCYTWDWEAICNSVFYASENNGYPSIGSGLLFNDGSAVSMTSVLECWPSIVNQGSPLAEADYIVTPFVLDYVSFCEVASSFGFEYSEGNRYHYVYGWDRGNRDIMSNYEVYFY